MSEFERAEEISAWADVRELQFPEDFSEEEAAFARQMHELFAVDCEELPPLYVQTLLDEERLRIPNISFEERVTGQVFESLHLAPNKPDPLIHKTTAAGHPASGEGRRLVNRRPSPVRRLWKLVLSAQEYFSRPMSIAAAVLLFMMVLTLVFASPSFAKGLRILLGDTGVVQLKNAPTPSPRTSKHQQTSSNTTASSDVDFDPSMPLFWLGRVAGNYVYDGTQLEPPPSAGWSKAAIVDIQYGMLNNGQGSGALDIREFQVSSADSAVLQVVEDGYATGVTLSDGDAAVFVDGMWEQRVFDRTVTSIWTTGTRCLLIMERQGVVIWMAGDPRNGMNADTMANIASQLVPATQATLTYDYRRIGLAGIGLAGTSLADSVNFPSGSEWYLVIPAGISPASGIGQFVYSGSTTEPGSGSLGSSSG
jgi:hypothetical protein